MASEKTPSYTDHDGYKLAMGFPLDGFRSCLEYEAKDEDLFIVTYPKVCVQVLYIDRCTTSVLFTLDTSSNIFLLLLEMATLSAAQRGHNT
jgi:hypothetical protein